MKNLNYAAIFAVLAILALPFAGCKKAEDAATSFGASSGANETQQAAFNPNYGDWLMSYGTADPENLNPITSNSVNSSEINSHIFETLLAVDPDTTDFVPRVAESWVISENGLEYTFKIRDGIKWHDGEPLTVNDVCFSYNKIQDPEVDAAHLRNYYQDIESCMILDDSHVKFTYKKPYFRALIIVGFMDVFPEHIYGKGDFNKHPNNRSPIGSGPYTFEKWDTGHLLVLKRNEGWWGKNDDYWGKRVWFDQIHYKIISDTTVALQVVKKGELDTYEFVDMIQWEKETNNEKFLDQFEKFHYETTWGSGYNYVGWNSKKPEFSDKRVRRAMTMLMNRQAISDKLYYGLRPVADGPFNPKDGKHSPNVKPLPYDPDAALALLKEAGWTDSDGDGILDKDGVKFKFEMLIHNVGSTYEQIATIYKEDLDRVGIELDIKQLEWTVFLEKIQGHNFDAYMMGWGSSMDSDPYQIWHSSQIDGGSNYVGFRNEEADIMLEEARSTLDREKRNKMYQRFNEIVHEEQPYTFLSNYTELHAVTRRFENVTVHNLGLDSNDWYTPEDRILYK